MFLSLKPSNCSRTSNDDRMGFWIVSSEFIEALLPVLLSQRFYQRLFEQGAHFRRIDIEAVHTRIDHFALVRLRPIEGMARASGNLVHEGALRSAVAITKRMQGIDLAQVMRRAIEKLIFRQSLQMVVGLQSIERRFSKAIDILHRRKRLAFGDVDRACFARPRVDILKEIFVNVFQVIEVEIARNRVRDRDRDRDRGRVTRGRELPLEG